MMPMPSAGAERAEADDDADGDGGEALDVGDEFHGVLRDLTVGWNGEAESEVAEREWISGARAPSRGRRRSAP